jgi:hypothetical protein
MDGDDNLIKNTYLNLSKPAAFLGASKIHQTLKQLYVLKIYIKCGM